MHYTPPNLRGFFSGEGSTGRPRDPGPWPLYVLTAVVGLFTVPDTLFELTGHPWFQAWSLPLPGIWALRLSLVAAFLGGLRVLYVSLEELFRGHWGANLAVAIASVAAIVLGESWVAAEVVFIALVGECVEGMIYSRAVRELGKLVELAPQVAHVLRGGVEVNVPLDEVLPGETVVVRPGERVPVDGLVLAGQSAVDQSALTGESLPLDKQLGDAVHAGTLNQYGALEVRADKVGRETTLGQVFRLVSEAQQNKAPLERLADRYAHWFLPVVLAAAGVTFVVSNWGRPSWNHWNPTLAVLVVACPCALILATPAAVLAAMTWLARRGVILKSSAALERLATVDAMAFDKTGTVTTGYPILARIVTLGDTSEDELLRLAAGAESKSEHVLARTVVDAARRRGLAIMSPVTFTAHPGAGIEAHWPDAGDAKDQDSKLHVVVGNARLCEKQGLMEPELVKVLEEVDARGETPLIVVINGRVEGILCASDTLRPEAPRVFAELRALGIRRLALVTGDRPAAAARIAAELGPLDAVMAGQLPADKASWLAEWPGRKAMIGDGINDAPALAAAEVGIALGGFGSDLAAEAGDMVLLGDPLTPLPGLVRLSRELVLVIRQNILIFAFGVNATAILLANLGWLSPVAGAFYHLGGSVLVLLNSMRLLWFDRWDELWIGRWFSALDRLAENLSLPGVLDFLHRRGESLAKAAVGLALLAWSASNVHVLGPDERAVVTRYGRYRTELGPGLVWRMPVPFEQVYRERPDEIRSIEIGRKTSAPDLAQEKSALAAVKRGPRWPWSMWLPAPAGVTGEPGPPVIEWGTLHDGELPTTAGRDEALLLTGDEVLVEVAASVDYRIAPDGLQAYLFAAQKPEALLASAAQHALRTAAAHRPLDNLLTTGRAELEAETLASLRKAAARYGLGVEIVGVSIGDLHPPIEVVPSYRDVASAYEERQTAINNAESDSFETVLGAGGRAAELGEQAAGERIRRTSTALGDSARFLARQQAFRKSPALTETRLYWESVERAHKDRALWVLDPRVVGRRSLFLGDTSRIPPLAPQLNPPRDPLAPAPVRGEENSP